MCRDGTPVGGSFFALPPTVFVSAPVSAPRVSVVVVTWNGRGLLERFLPSVLATDYPDVEVVVADNASTDGTAAWLAAEHPGVVVVRHSENELFARGNNLAVPAASGSVLCFLNNDVEVPSGWLGPLVGALGGGVVAVQPKLLQHGDRDRFEYAGASGGFLDAAGVPFTRGRIFDTMEPDRGQYDDPRDVFWATGAALVVDRAAFEAVGGFDESFGMHMEEIDLCWRLQRAGGRIRVEPASEVYHLGGASLPVGPRKTFLNVRNSLVMLAKNLPPAEARRAFRQRRLLDTAAIAQALLRGDRPLADAIRQGRAEAAERIRSVEPPPPDEPPVLPPYRGSIAADAKLRGRHHFSDLPADRFAPRWR